MILFWSFVFILTLTAMLFVIRPLWLGETSALSISLVFALPITAILLYFFLGNSHLVAAWLTSEKNAILVKQELAKYQSPAQIIDTLSKKLQQMPADKNSAKGWHLLGKLYFNNNQIGPAISAFETAVQLNNAVPDYLLDLIAARFYQNKRLSNDDKILMNRLLVLSPNNINAINLLALDAYQHKDFSTAIRHWETLLMHFPPGSEDSNNLLAMIAQAQQQPSKNVKSQLIKIHIQLDKAFANAVNSHDTLFVSALEANGSRIPLAVARLSASQFPCDVTLDSRQSMLPGRSLTTVNKIIIRARIAKGGGAMPMKGDFLGETAPFNWLSHPKAVVIISKSV